MAPLLETKKMPTTNPKEKEMYKSSDKEIQNNPPKEVL